MKKKLLWILIAIIVTIVLVFAYFYFGEKNISKTGVQNQSEIGNLNFEYTKKSDCYNSLGKKQENYSYDKNNNLINCYDKNGKKTGVRNESMFGFTAVLTYKDGVQLLKPGIVYSPDGTVYAYSNYATGDNYIKTTYLNDSGAVKEIEYYDEDGLKLGDELFSEEGNLRKKISYLGTERDYDITFFYKNGKIEGKQSVRNNEFEGESIDYYENGQLKEKKYFSSGDTVGEYVSYYENG